MEELRRMPRAVGILDRLRSRSVEPLWDAMERVATRGDLATRCAPLPDSRLSSLREAFDAMLERLEHRERARERHRRLLTAKLAECERELERQKIHQQELLQALAQALIVVDRAGRPRAERSAAFDRFFGAPEPGQTLSQVMARASAGFAHELAQGLLRVEDGILPLPLALAQLPEVLHSDQGPSFRFAYRALEDGSACVLVTISEITDSVALRERADDHAELVGLLERVSDDRAAFVRSFEESEQLIYDISEHRTGDQALERLELHTLGDNLSTFGRSELSTLLGAIVQRSAAHGLSEGDRQLLSEIFQRFAERARPLLGIEPGRSELGAAMLDSMMAETMAQAAVGK